ncbi:MAG: ATPase associated with various cellular 3 [Pseudonocardiales bacterium]|nr:ATPase associated with various cellular 3 [Jatrophihabitantaceae bacterium]MCW2604857.1 ATPase associated with various cellular 3 [Pseudonocardiales bacterium]
MSVTSYAQLDATSPPARALDGANGGSTDQRPSPAEVARIAARIVENISAVIEGKTEVIRLGVAVLLAEGHLLIEDVPGVGKTKLAKALARSIDCTVRRIQFTPDLLPSDITGISVYNRETGEFDFKPGAVFANLVVGDEINRASPRAQAALLECMEERQVSSDGVTYHLEAPFMVVATQNPLEMEGTYPLPEAQRDRFTARLSMGYPDAAAELKMLGEQALGDPLDRLTPVSSSSEIRAAVQAVRHVHVTDEVKRYVISLADATRRSPLLRLGASPRASVQWIRVAKAWAAVAGRDYVSSADIKSLAEPVLAHRMLLARAAHGAQRDMHSIIAEITASVPAPEARA